MLATQIPNRAHARDLWLQALDQWSLFAVDSARVLFKRSIAADPRFLPAHYDLFEMTSYLGEAVQLRDEYARRSDLPPDIRDCFHLFLKMHDAGTPEWIPEFQQLQKRYGSTPCVSLGLSRSLRIMRAPSAAELASARIAANAFPDHAASVEELLASLDRHGKSAEAMELARKAAQATPHIIQRIRFRIAEAHSLARRGDSAAAHAIARAIEADVRRDGRAYVRYSMLERFGALGQSATVDDETDWRTQMQIARAADMPAFEASVAMSLAGLLVETGRMDEAIALVRRHTEYAERHHLHNHQLRLRLLEGRALGRSGRNLEAIPVLTKALGAAARIGSVHYTAEAQHQLMHAYEGLRQWRDAVQASDNYIAAAQRTADTGPRVMSYHDAADIRRKAGWHAAADSLSRMMVRAIEREQRHYAYAAEYFERVGDLGRAITYLRRASKPDASGHVADQKVVYAGITRLHLALGNLDSAMATARVHDSLRSTFDEILAPRVLALAGRTPEAVALMRDWSRFQAQRSNVRGQVKALISLAEVLLQASPADAAAVAAEADSLARAHGFMFERTTAVRMRGDASRRLGRSDALRHLRDARSLARAHPDVMEQILVEIALADGLSVERRYPEALEAYRVAIDLIDRSGGTIHDDVTAARFKSARAQAFNGALRSVLAGPADANAVLLWSARKKASRTSDPAAGAGLRAIRARLAPDAALVDYVVVDTTIWAVVVTTGGSALHRLLLSSTEAQSLSRRIVQPLTAVFAGRLDLARAPFDVTAARRLYDGLLGPLEPALPGVRHIVLVPDAPLHAVPFDALVTSSAATPTSYALDRWSISYSLAPVIAANPRRARATDSLLLVLGDAPGTSRERKLVREQWRNRVQLLEGAEGTESNVVRDAKRYAILHVAAHARSNERDPLASYLALRANATHDGLLHYAEIEEARARHTLVILNACETSTGELLAGSGFMSLARAFLISGSTAVIATQWPIGAASATLIGHFYDQLNGGASVHDALQRAKLLLRQDPATAHPFYWASHVLLQSF